MSKIRKDDEVIVITGKHKGVRGKVLSILDGRVTVAGVNVVKKAQRPNPMTGVAGGLVDKVMPIDISNVALFNAATGKADRVGYKHTESGKIRVFRSNGEAVGA